MSLIVALLGAECTGKSSLTQRLGERLAAPTVPEYLREWCVQQGRTPRRQEQAAIAAEQQRRIRAALPAALLISDTTSLMTAVYSQHYFEDDSLLPEALAAQRTVALNLLCCPEGIPWQGDGCLRDGEAARDAVHRRLLALLNAHGLPYALLQGPLERRVEEAESLIRERIGGHNGRLC